MQDKMAFNLIVEAFSDGAPIPRRFTCDGDDISPELRWQGEPASTKSFALLLEDPDAPGGTWNHWLMWDIPAQVHSLPQGSGLPRGAKSGTNDFSKRGYGGPCPPRRGGPHRYYFRLFALNVATLGLPESARRPAFEDAVMKHALAEASYMGRYDR